MQKTLTLLLAGIFFLTGSAWGVADFDSLISQSDTLVDECMRDFKTANRHEKFMQSATLCIEALKLKPDNFEACWRVSRGYRLYTESVYWDLWDNWKQIGKKYGKIGMQYGEKAIDLNPDRAEGYFWYGGNVSTYALSVSIITAFREGLKDKTEEAFLKVEQLDSSYWHNCCYMALGRFYYVLPWPFRDKQKAVEYLEKFNCKSPNFYSPEGVMYLGEALLDSKDPKVVERGRQMLERAAASEIAYFRQEAKEILARKLK